MQAEEFNHRIRRIDMAIGTVTTLAGRAGSSGYTDGLGSAATFNSPLGVAMDSMGATAIVVSDKGYGAHVIKRLGGAIL